MPKPLPGKKDYIAIGEAAQLLGVSIDTIRRWDHAGKLTSVRLDGKNRYFVTEELRQLKESLPLTISQTAFKLGVSASTLRRLEQKGLLESTRNSRGERLYDPEKVQEFLANVKRSKSSVRNTRTNEYSSSVPAPKVKSIYSAPQTDVTHGEIPRLENPEMYTSSDADSSTPTVASALSEQIQNELKSPEPVEEFPSPFEVAISPERVTQLHNTPLIQHDLTPSREKVTQESHFAPIVRSISFPKKKTTFPKLPSFNPVQMSHLQRQGIFFALFLVVLTASLGTYAAVSRNREVPTGDNAQQANSSVRSVLAESTRRISATLHFNIPSVFNEEVTLNKELDVKGTSLFADDITVQEGDLTLETGSIAVNTGTVTASNLIYSITGGENVTVTGGQNAVISVDIPEVDSVLSLQGQSGALSFTAGSGISIDGLTISNSDKGSAQNIFKTISVDGTTFDAGSNTDTLKFVAGTGILLTPDTSTKQITITSSGSSPGWVDDGSVIRLETATDNVGVGTTSPGAKLESQSAGTPQLRLSYDGSAYVNFETGAGGNLSVSATGSQVNFSGLNVSASSFTCTDCLNLSEVSDSLTLDGNLTISPSASNFTVNIDSGTLFVDSANNRIGIGTTAPEQALHVAGNIQITGNTNISGVNYDWPNADGTNGYVLTTDGSGGLAWTDASGIAASINYFELNNGLLSTKYNTPDFAIGGTSTASAKFAVTNVNSGVPRATVSDGTDSIYMAADGTLATTNTADLTIGSATTGSVKIFGFGAGVVQSDGTGTLSSSALDLAAGSSLITGILPVANGGTGANTLTDLISLGTHTTGNYVTSITNGSGITGGNGGSEGSALTLAINLTTSLDTSTQSSNSGLEVSASGLSLLRGCDDEYILKWNDTTKLWECAPDVGGLSSAVVNVQEGDVTVSSSAATLDYNATDFALTESPAGEINIDIDYANSGILRAAQNETITGSYTFTNASPLVFEGSTPDGFETSFAFTDPTTDNIITFPNVSGEVTLLGQTIANNELINSSITVTAGSGMSGGGLVSLGGTITLDNDGVLSLNSATGALTLANSSESGGIITIDNAAANGSTKGIAAFNATNFSALSGVINTIQDITTTSSPTFNGLTISSLTRDSDTITDFTGTGLTLNSGSLETTLGTDVDLTSEVTGTLGETNGGTGQSTYTTGDILYSDGANSLAKLGIGTEGQLLAVSPGGIPAWISTGSLNYFQRNSQAISPINVTDDLLLGSNATASALIRFGGTTNADSFFNTGGNVGIGITNPVHRLSVSGTTNITGLATFGAGVNVGSETITDFTGTGLTNNGGSLETTLGTDVALSTETTGDYVATITGSGTITSSGATIGEGIAHTLSVTGDSIGDTQLAFNTGQHLTSTSTPTFSTLALTSLIISGDTISDFVGTGLTLSGNTLTTTLGTDVDLTSEVTGILPVANGGTGANTLNDLITLSTHTTGDYVSTITGSGTITSSGAVTGEGIAHTLSVTGDSIGDTQLAFNTGQHLTSTSDPTFDALSLTSLTVSGDTINDFVGTGLTLSGNTLTTTLGTDIDLASAEVTGILALSNGGTNANLTAVNGGIVWSDADSFEVSGAGNAGEVLVSGGTGAPTWVDAATLGTNYFQRNSQAISPVNVTDDLLLGANATASALIRFGGTTNADSFINTGGNVGKVVFFLGKEIERTIGAKWLS